MKRRMSILCLGLLCCASAFAEEFIIRMSGNFVELHSPDGSRLGSFCVPDMVEARTNGEQIVVLCRDGWIKVFNRSGSQQSSFFVPNAVGIQVMSDGIAVQRSDTRNISIYDMQGSLRRSI